MLAMLADSSVTRTNVPPTSPVSEREGGALVTTYCFRVFER